MATSLKCIIIDDEPLARELLKSYVAKTHVLTLEGSFGSASEAIKTVVNGDTDIIFLDINMPMLNGIELASIIPPATRIIYVTAYEQYALQGFKVNALDYLLKPVSYPEFLKAVGKAVEWHNMQEAVRKSQSNGVQTITLKADHKLMRIPFESILYIEVQGDRLIFYRKEGEPVSSLMSMKEIEEGLPADIFMRIHRSFIVNINNVEIVERGRVVFGKTYIPISDTRREEFLSRIGR